MTGLAKWSDWNTLQPPPLKLKSGRFTLNISPLYLVWQHYHQRVLEDRLLDLTVKFADHREVQVNPDPSPGGESDKTGHWLAGPPIQPAVGPKPKSVLGRRELV